MKGLFGQRVEPIATENRKHKAILSLARGRRYRQTSKGKATEKHRHKTPKCKGQQKKYEQTGKRKALKKKYAVRFNLKNPNNRKAKRAVAQAILNGRLISFHLRACYYCYEQAELYHHYLGYEPEHWLDVIPVCTGCHGHVNELRAPEIVNISTYRNFRRIG